MAICNGNIVRQTTTLGDARMQIRCAVEEHEDSMSTLTGMAKGGPHKSLASVLEGSTSFFKALWTFAISSTILETMLR